MARRETGGNVNSNLSLRLLRNKTSKFQHDYGQIFLREYKTMKECFLFDSRAWNKVKARLEE